MQEIKDDRKKPSPPKKPLIFYYAVALVVLMLLNAFFFPTVLERQVIEVPYSQFLTMVDNNQVSELALDEDSREIVFIGTDDSGKEYKFLQTMYISEKNSDGNYYIYTVIDFPSGNISLDMICEVSSATLNFLIWDSYKWVYPEFLQIGIAYTEEITVTLPDYSINFDLHQSKVDETNVMELDVTDSNGNSFSTFGILDFKDRHGNRWIITPSTITVYDSSGTEIKPSSRHYEYNAIGEQVRVIDEQIIAEDGRRIRVTKDYIEIIYADNSKEEFLRYQNTLFKKLFVLTTGISIIDSYDMTEEEEAALIADPSNFIASVKIKDNEGGELTVEYYKLTARKMYIKVNGSGGFYVSSSHVKKFIDAIDKFLNGTDISTEF